MSERKTKMKLSSRRNGTLVPDDDDSDSDLQEFPLPKKRIIKPGKSTYVARLDSPSALFYQDEKPVRSSTMHYIIFFSLDVLIHFRTFQTALWLLPSLCFSVPLDTSHSFRSLCISSGMV